MCRMVCGDKPASSPVESPRDLEAGKGVVEARVAASYYHARRCSRASCMMYSAICCMLSTSVATVIGGTWMVARLAQHVFTRMIRE